jgi:hypothetical protein
MDHQYNTYEHETRDKQNLMKTPAAKDMGSTLVPPIEQITGESVMPSEAPLVPLVPTPSPMQEPMSLRNPYQSQGYLQQHIGQNMRVQFLIGSNGPLVDRTGVLVEVGESYIVLQPTNTDDLLMCDLYSIKFVTIYR